MQICLNDEWVNIPASTAEITLKQKIDFQAQYGDELDLMAKSISEMKDLEKELETLQFQFEQMFRTFAFFTNTTVEALKESEFIDKIASIYYSCLSQMNTLDEIQDLVQTHEWNGEEWVIDHPQLKNGDRITFGEFIDAKQIIQNMLGLSKNRWECLIPLCAIFLRKKDELYDQSFLYEDSERLKLMETVPLSIALHVGFFLSISLSIYTQTFQSLAHQE